jgi:hypothetical protein
MKETKYGKRKVSKTTQGRGSVSKEGQSQEGKLETVCKGPQPRAMGKHRVQNTGGPKISRLSRSTFKKNGVGRW